MRILVRKVAHIFERIGLAMAGAASGLFVGVHVGSSIALLTSQGFLLVMMLSGTIGFYLGIDTPPQTFENGTSRKVDASEFLSAAGTFLAALTAFVSVAVIVLRDHTHIFWTTMILLAWTAGVTMQIVAGAITRFRAR